jgi:hypothetical protein
MRTRLVEDCFHRLGATPAAPGNAKVLAQLVQAGRAQFGASPNFAIRDGVANADKHDLASNTEDDSRLIASDWQERTALEPAAVICTGHRCT